MQKTKHLTGILVILVALAGIIGSASPKKAFHENQTGWRPEDFSASSGTLLIERVTWPKNQGEKIESFMAKNYPYKYEFVDKDQWDDAKYNNKKEYQFLLRYDGTTRDMDRDVTDRRTMIVTAFDFYFTDRESNRTYPKTGIASSYASATFEALIKEILEKNP